MYSKQAEKKYGIGNTSAILMSQSQITSGNENLDEFMNVSIGLKQIGKLILDLPKSIDELKKIGSSYMKNLGTQDVL